MSIYSPTVLPTSGRSLAQALGQGVNTYLQTRRQKQEDDLEAEQRQRAEAMQNATLGEQGIHILRPGETAPVAQNGANVPQALAHALNPSLGLPDVAAPTHKITAGDGYYIDRDQQQQHYAQQSAVAQALALAKALGAGTAERLIDPNKIPDAHAVAQSTVRKNEAQAAGPTGKTLPTAGGYVQVGRDGTATPLLGSNGRPLMPFVPPPAPPSNVYVTGVGPDGKPTIFAGKNKGTPALVDTGVGKPSGGGSGGSSLSDTDRARMVAQAAIDNAEMKRIEARVLRGELNFGTAAGVAGAASQAHGGAGNEILGVLGNAAAGAIDPDIQKYFTAQASYGRIMGNLQSKRYTDHQAEIERRISGMQGNDLQNTIAYKQSLRDASLADTEQPSHSAPAGNGHPSHAAAPAPARGAHGKKTYTYGGVTYEVPE